MTTTQAAGEEHVYLVGHVPLREYLEFMCTEPIDAADADTKRLAEEWRAANDHLQELQAAEAGWPDQPPVQPVPRDLQALVDRVGADPIFQRSFAVAPATIGMVDLDRLVVHQRTIHVAHVERLKQQLGAKPDPEKVFRHCLPFDHARVPFRLGRVSKYSYVFVSESNDLRFLESVVFGAEQLKEYQPHGPIAGVVGLVIGYGSNYLNVIACENRMVLNNGFHRSYALRCLGITHAPCVIQKITRREELGVVGAGALRRNPDLYLRSPRPPVLKDYFNPRLCRTVRLAPQKRHVRVSFTIEEVDMP